MSMIVFEALEVDIADIYIDPDRLRMADAERVSGLKRSIEALGLMQSIVVAKRKGNTIQSYILVAGLHRLTACTELGWKGLSVKVVEGTKAELLEYQIMENLARKDLSVSERATFVAQLKETWDSSDQFIGRGGDRKSDEYDQTATVADWSEIMAKETGWGRRTLERAYMVGKILTPMMKDVLKGNPLLDNQKQLEELAKLKLSEDVRLDVARAIVDGKAKTVKGAHLIASGKVATTPAEMDPQDKILLKLKSAWKDATQKTKNAFLIGIEDELDG